MYIIDANMNTRGFIIIFSILWGYCLCNHNGTTRAVTKPTPNYRLPRTIFPEHYKLNVLTHINDDEGFKYYGDVRIKVIVFYFYLFECFTLEGINM